MYASGLYASGDDLVIGILSDSEMESILSRNRVGRLAMCNESTPYVVPISYRYDGQSILAFSGPGQKIEIMRSQPRVALLVDEIVSQSSWKSVLVEGVYQEITDVVEREQAVAVLSSNGAPILPSGMAREVGLIFLRIIPSMRSGRFETHQS
ncbi:MAG: pyridoxamine 5'-phosphate oxidase family protein [Thermomicrobiales bacterium]